jgi:chromosome partitioning protein
MKGGVGKTTLAVNLADFLYNRSKKRVLVVDVDPQFNATQCIISGEKYIEYIDNGGNTIIDIFDSATKKNVSIVNGSENKEPIPLKTISPYVSKRGFHLIPSKLDLFRYEMAAGQGKEMRLKNYLKIVSNDYDICIIDSPPTPSAWMASALIASDYYLIPVKPDPISMTGIDLLEGIINEKRDNYGCDCTCCGVVLTMTEQNTKVFTQALGYFKSSQKWKKYLYKKTLPKRTDIPRGQLSNIFIRDLENSSLKNDFAGIVQEFLERVGK